MEVKEFQKLAVQFMDQWDKKRNVQPSETLTFTHLVEEVGELASQYVSQTKRPEEYDEKELENAIGDIFLQTIKLAHLRGLDIEKLVTDIFEEEAHLLKE